MRGFMPQPDLDDCEISFSFRRRLDYEAPPYTHAIVTHSPPD